MANNGNEIRARLFDLYSANLTVHVPEVRDLFVCPICARDFGRSAVISRSEQDVGVDIAHVYPQANGGRLYTLECRGCNGRMNRRGDAALTNLHNLWDIVTPGRGGRPLPAQIEHAGRRINVELSGGPDGMRIHGHFSHNDPDVFRGVVEAMMGGAKCRIDCTARDAHPGKINIAVLHSAHLLMFRELAYGYLFTPVGQRIRRLLETSDRLDDAPYLSVTVPTSSGIDPRILYRAGICTLADGTRCLFAALPSPDPSVVVQIVLLPGPRQQNQDEYAAVTAKAGSWIDATYQTIGGGPVERLMVPDYANYLFLAWDGWAEHNIDMTKIMYAVYRECSGTLATEVDAVLIGYRFGITGAYLSQCVESLTSRGFLVRVPSGSEQQQRVYLTAKGAKPIEEQNRDMAKPQPLA